MSEQPRPVRELVLRLLIALPLLYALWFYSAPLLFSGIPWLLEGILTLTMPGAIESIHLDGREIVFDTLFAVQAADGRWGMAVIEADMLMYSFSLPTLWALLWASVALKGLGRKFLLAYLFLLPTWLWGLAFWFAKVAVFRFSPQGAYPPGAVTLELIALGYQFGTLILPSIAVVLGWALLCPGQVQVLFGNLSAYEQVPERGRSSRAKTRGRNRRRRKS